jgi:hypothetical protein
MEYDDNTSIKLNYASSVACPSPINVGGQPLNVDAKIGGVARFSVKVSNPNLVYRWYRYDGQTWNPLNSNEFYSGVETNTLTIGNLPVSFAGNKYYCEIRNAQCVWNSTSAVLSVCGETVEQPMSAKVRAGDSIFFQAKTNDSRTEYIWQVSDGSGFILCDTTRYTITAGGQKLAIMKVPLNLNNARFRCLMKAPGCSTDTSSEATLTVETGTAVEEAVPVVPLTLSPNPANTILNISPTSGFISCYCYVTNALGQVVAAFLVDGETSSLDISSLSNGLYNLRLGNRSQMFVVTH